MAGTPPPARLLLVEQVPVAAPARMKPAGTIIEDHRPRVGIWLMPDNGSPGEIEDFIGRLVPAGDPVWPRAQRYIDGIPPQDRKFREGKIRRAEIHAWLAAREKPRKMGAAIGCGDLNAAAAPAKRFVAWLRRLFGDAPPP